MFNNQRVLLINPPSPFLIDDLTYPNLGICYLSSALESVGIEKEIIDLAGEVDWKILEGHKNVDIVAISSISAQFPIVKKLLAYVYSLYPNAIFVAGGPGVTVAPDDYLKIGFDQVVIGEGELAIIDITRGNRTEKIELPYIKNIDFIPFPDRSNLDHYHGAATIITSRGCYWGKCSFCCRNFQGIRFRSAENVIEELKEIKKAGSTRLVLYDTNFLCFRHRDIKIIKALGNMGFEWRCSIRANDILKNEEILIMAAQNGLKEVFVGVESVTDEILKKINKGITAEESYKAIKLLQKHGIIAKAAILIGLPGETKKSLENLKKWLKKTQPDKVSPSLMVVMPGTDIWEHPEGYDIIFNRKDSNVAYNCKPGTYTSTISTSNLSAKQLLEAHTYFMKISEDGTF